MKRADVVPSPSNRGVISTEPTNRAATSTEPTFSNLKRGRALMVLLHWLSATTVVYGSPDDVVAFISAVLGHGPEVYPWGQNFYTKTYVWAGGLKLLHNDIRPEMGLCLVADGNACEYHGFDLLASIYRALHLKATRLDLAVDGCRFTPSALRKLWLKDLVRTQARPVKNAKPGRKTYRSNSWITSPTGDTFYMGSKTSTQFARCYNMRGFTRFEMVLTDERAAQIMGRLCSGEPLAPTVGASISQFVAFVELDDTNRSRCTVLPFWKKFLCSLGCSGVTTRLEARPEPSVERIRAYIEHQVAPSLAAYYKLSTEPEASLACLLQRGAERIKPKHQILIATSKERRLK